MIRLCNIIMFRITTALIVAIILPLLSLQLQIPLLTKPLDSKNYLPVTINSGGYLLQLGLSPLSYVFAKLQSPRFSPDFLKSLFVTASLKKVQTGDLTCMSDYCNINQVDTQNVTVLGENVGTGISVNMDIKVHDKVVPKFLMHAVFLKNQSYTNDGRIDVFQLITSFKQQGYIEGKNVTFFLGHQKRHISFDENSSFHEMARVSNSNKGYNTIKMNGLIIGQEVFDVTELVLSLDMHGLHVPVNISQQLIKSLLREGLVCQFHEDRMSCQYTNRYPSLNFMLSNSSLGLPLDKFLKSCYFSFEKSQLLCDFDIIIHQETSVHAGSLFLETYPLTIDLINNFTIIHEGYPDTKTSHPIIFFIHRVLGLQLPQMIMFGVFLIILLIIKSYHFIYKCRPISTYSKYGNLISTSTSSIQSQNSQRDPKEIDTVKDLQIQEI